MFDHFVGIVLDDLNEADWSKLRRPGPPFLAHLLHGSRNSCLVKQGIQSPLHEVTDRFRVN